MENRIEEMSFEEYLVWHTVLDLKQLDMILILNLIIDEITAIIGNACIFLRHVINKKRKKIVNQK